MTAPGRPAWHFYGVDPAGPRPYHLLTDSTRVPEPTVAGPVTAAALAFSRRRVRGAPPGRATEPPIPS
ncbi:hypothetical protein GCM10022416_10930 [Actinomadura keratinilytica]|uniref:Uncharacterized protein n=1 Tax=Actinomadura keratinilytica TaxID=547461 RepID=A0ABP7Y722_9ACTN